LLWSRRVTEHSCITAARYESAKTHDSSTPDHFPSHGSLASPGRAIRELASRLEKFSAQITRCRVIVEPPSHHKHQGNLYDFRIDITLPDTEIAIRHSHPADQAHEDPYVALCDAFRLT
jgi:hypothetical protein